MRWSTLVLAAALLWAGPLHGDTLFDKRKSSLSIQRFQQFLWTVRGDLYAKNAEIRRNTFRLVAASLEKPPLDGDWEFPLLLLGDLMLGTEFPAQGELDGDLQGDALELLIDNALEDDFPVSRREFALGQLRRVVRAKNLARASFRQDAFDALVKLSRDEQLVLAHGALNAIATVALESDKAWENVAEAAAELLADRMEDKRLEVRRIAIVETIAALEAADQPGDTAGELLEELTEAAEELGSPALRRDLRPYFRALLEGRAGRRFAERAAKVARVVKAFDTRVEAARDPYPEVLADFAKEDDLADLEARLARIEREGGADPTVRAIGLGAISAKASRPGLDAYTLRVLLDSLVQQGRLANSRMAFYRTATQLLDLSFTHRHDGLAHLPLAYLARQLASTDQPSLVVPVLEEIANLAMSQSQPVWVGRRMVALLFLQAGDSPNPAIRRHALALLERVGSSGRNWAIRREVWERLALLARFARDAEVKAQATRWLAG